MQAGIAVRSHTLNPDGDYNWMDTTANAIVDCVLKEVARGVLEEVVGGVCVRAFSGEKASGPSLLRLAPKAPSFAPSRDTRIQAKQTTFIPTRHSPPSPTVAGRTSSLRGGTTSVYHGGKFFQRTRRRRRGRGRPCQGRLDRHVPFATVHVLGWVVLQDEIPDGEVPLSMLPALTGRQRLKIRPLPAVPKQLKCALSISVLLARKSGREVTCRDVRQGWAIQEVVRRQGA